MTVNTNTTNPDVGEAPKIVSFVHNGSTFVPVLATVAILRQFLPADALDGQLAGLISRLVPAGAAWNEATREVENLATDPVNSGELRRASSDLLERISGDLVSVGSGTVFVCPAVTVADALVRDAVRHIVAVLASDLSEAEEQGRARREVWAWGEECGLVRLYPEPEPEQEL